MRVELSVEHGIQLLLQALPDFFVEIVLAVEVVKHQINEQLIGYLYAFHSILSLPFRDDCDGIFDTAPAVILIVTTVTERKGKKRMKNVQIPYELFVDLVLYHLNGEDDFDEEIRQGLEQKLDAILNRQLYSQYKTAPTEEQREQARQEYLDRRGVPQSYRWTTSPWEL